MWNVHRVRRSFSAKYVNAADPMHVLHCLYALPSDGARHALIVRKHELRPLLMLLVVDCISACALAKSQQVV
jgi:hypothetical protein